MNFIKTKSNTSHVYCDMGLIKAEKSFFFYVGWGTIIKYI